MSTTSSRNKKTRKVVQQDANAKDRAALGFGTAVISAEDFSDEEDPAEIAVVEQPVAPRPAKRAKRTQTKVVEPTAAAPMKEPAAEATLPAAAVAAIQALIVESLKQAMPAAVSQPAAQKRGSGGNQVLFYYWGRACAIQGLSLYVILLPIAPHIYTENFGGVWNVHVLRWLIHN
jgi:hypothetical protein